MNEFERVFWSAEQWQRIVRNARIARIPASTPLLRWKRNSAAEMVRRMARVAVDMAAPKQR